METHSLADILALTATVALIFVLSRNGNASSFVTAFANAFEETVSATYASFERKPQAASSANAYSGPQLPSKPPATQGSSGGSGFGPQGPTGGAGGGVGGGGGGSW